MTILYLKKGGIIENLFKYLTDKEFAYLEKTFELKEYQDGETVIEEGTGGDQMYYITDSLLLTPHLLL